MALAEARKMDKGDGGRVAEALGWAPRKLGELKTFFGEVQTELKKVTWPGRNEVYTTTIVVLITTVFFGFYLWGLDLVFSRIASFILR
jgi:preprotein translocase subunit SecE